MPYLLYLLHVHHLVKYQATGEFKEKLLQVSPTSSSYQLDSHSAFKQNITTTVQNRSLETRRLEVAGGNLLDQVLVGEGGVVNSTRDRNDSQTA